MEPIRPDHDELRATADESPGGPPAPEPRKGRGTRAAGTDPASRPSGRGGAGWLLWLLLLAVAAAGALGWYSQKQQLDALQAQLQEADQWIRQSRLALARFEGELSETGEDLQERGQTLEARIASNRKQLDTATEEIRKLWALADKRNRVRLDSHEERLAAVDASMTDIRQSLDTVRTDQAQLLSGLSALEQQLASQVTALQEGERQLATRVDTLAGQVEGVDALIDARLRRFEQELKLTLEGMESRLAAVEKRSGAAAGQAEVRALRQELSALAGTVESIDASRAQLTSRLVRVSDRLDRLETRLGGQ